MVADGEAEPEAEVGLSGTRVTTARSVSDFLSAIEGATFETLTRARGLDACYDAGSSVGIGNSDGGGDWLESFGGTRRCIRCGCRSGSGGNDDGNESLHWRRGGSRGEGGGDEGLYWVSSWHI